jgi:hypothetical protein
VIGHGVSNDGSKNSVHRKQLDLLQQRIMDTRQGRVLNAFGIALQRDVVYAARNHQPALLMFFHQALCDAAQPPIEIVTDKAVEPGATLATLWSRPQPRKRLANHVSVVILQGRCFACTDDFAMTCVQSPVNFR